MLHDVLVHVSWFLFLYPSRTFLVRCCCPSTVCALADSDNLSLGSGASIVHLGGRKTLPLFELALRHSIIRDLFKYSPGNYVFLFSYCGVSHANARNLNKNHWSYFTLFTFGIKLSPASSVWLLAFLILSLNAVTSESQSSQEMAQPRLLTGSSLLESQLSLLTLVIARISLTVTIYLRICLTC